MLFENAFSVLNIVMRASLRSSPAFQRRYAFVTGHIPVPDSRRSNICGRRRGEFFSVCSNHIHIKKTSEGMVFFEFCC